MGVELLAMISVALLGVPWLSQPLAFRRWSMWKEKPASHGA